VRGCAASGFEADDGRALSALDREPALLDALPFELHEATEAFETFFVAVAPARFEHADAVDDRGNRGAHAAAEVLAKGPNA
jgi:hypothetical protein